MEKVCENHDPLKTVSDHGSWSNRNTLHPQTEKFLLQVSNKDYTIYQLIKFPTVGILRLT